MTTKVGVDDYIIQTGAGADDVSGLPREELGDSAAARRGVSQAARLVSFVAPEALFLSTDGETSFADIPVNGHRETWPIRSKGFRRWLTTRPISAPR